MRRGLTVLSLLAVFTAGALPATAQPAPPPPEEVYFCNVSERAIYTWSAAAGTSEVHRVKSVWPISFAIAPWDPNRLFVLGKGRGLLIEVDLATGTETRLEVPKTTILRDIAFDPEGTMYFSTWESIETQGEIWRMNAAGGASLYFSVDEAALEGSFTGGGYFGFDPDGKLLLKAHGSSSASLYEVDVATGKMERLVKAGTDAFAGFAFDAAGNLSFADNRAAIATLDLTTGRYDGYYRDPRPDAQITKVAFRPATPPPPPSVAGMWVMPSGLKGFRVDQIKPTGLVDYPASNPSVFDAPFGGHLGFLLESSGEVPDSSLFYYRLSYRREGTTAWIDFDAPVSIHYVHNRPGQTPIFPLFALGPTSSDGVNLYRFRPREAELAKELGLPEGSVEWPKVGFPGDVYRGHLNTVAKGLDHGKIEIRYEVYDEAGPTRVPGSRIQMIVPTGTAPDGSLLTRKAPLVDDGFQFTLHIDNRPTEGEIEAPSIGTTVADECGFLRYGRTPGDVRLGWRAWHPGEFATYSFALVKGASGVGSLPLPPTPGDPEPSLELPITDEVASTAHNGQGGRFWELSPTQRLLGDCNEAAFAASLHVVAKAVNGDGVRLSGYDTRVLRAFAIAPK